MDILIRRATTNSKDGSGNDHWAVTVDGKDYDLAAPYLTTSLVAVVRGIRKVHLGARLRLDPEISFNPYVRHAIKRTMKFGLFHGMDWSGVSEALQNPETKQCGHCGHTAWWNFEDQIPGFKCEVCNCSYFRRYDGKYVWEKKIQHQAYSGRWYPAHLRVW